jgi:outer membrane receptor protein involved in Fe transport
MDRCAKSGFGKWAVYWGIFVFSYGAFAQGAAEEQLTEVVVTGSRVVTNGNDSPTPVTVVNVQEMEAVRPGTIADQLNDMPQFSGSQTQQSGIGNGGANGGNPNGAGNVLNLRNFGTTRNLILFDGHRVAPNSPNGTVDVDMIPQLLLKRVDVVTGGASAVYGADAVTGVVNFITDTKFTGLKTNGQFGRSAQSDGDTAAIGAAWGTDLFGGRGHFMGSYEYRGDKGIDNRSSRQWGRNRWLLAQVTAPAGFSARQLIPFATRQDASFGGTISAIGATPNPLNNYYFASNGVVAPVVPGDPIPGKINARDGSNGSGSYFDQSLKAKLNTHQLFGRLDYDFSDSLHGWAKVAGTDNFNSGYAISNPSAQASNNSNVHAIYVSNPFLPASVRNLMTANGTNALAAANATFGLNKVHSGPGMDQYRQFAEISGRNYSFDTGLSGSFGDGWKWELAAVYGTNKLRAVAGNSINLRKLGAALDAVTPAGGGAPVCWVSTQAQFSSLYPGCVAYNVFGPSITSAEAAYLFDDIETTTHTNMKDVEAFVSGAPFNSWVGPVNVALSAQSRKSTYRVDSSFEPAGPGNVLNCAGLRLVTCNAASQSYFQGFSYSRAEKAVSVKEAALEFDLPLLADKFLARDVSLSGAFRYTNYSTSGNVNSWKAGLDWKLTDTLTFRGTRSRDIRAPTLHELYAPGAVGSYNGRDFWANVTLDGAAGRPNPAVTFGIGNEKLTPELANTTTLGFVYRPTWAQNLSVALDYYYISVKDAIINKNGTDEATMVACATSGGTSSVCSLIVRALDCCTQSAANYAVRLINGPVNVARQWTEGADLEINYSGNLLAKPYNLRLLTSYQPHNVQEDPLAISIIDYAGTTEVAASANAKLRASLIASMSLTDKLKVSVLERWRDRLDWYGKRILQPPGANIPIVTNSNGVASVAFTNLNVSYTAGVLSGQSEFFLNVQNLFDREPPVYAGTGAPFPGNVGTFAGDDGVGRFYTLGFRYKL